jgi:flagellar FliL protein
MASKGETQVAAEDHGGAGKKKKGLLLVVGAAVLTLALGGGGAWFFLSGKKETAGAEAKAKPKDEHPPMFVTLTPAFVVNLAGENDDYLQVAIDLKVADSKVPDRIKAHDPEIRNAILLLLSSKHREELVTLEGKNQLRQDIRAGVNAAIGIEAPQPAAPGEGTAAVGEAHASETPAAAADEHPAGVLDVLLTSFVIQAQ